MTKRMWENLKYKHSFVVRNLFSSDLKYFVLQSKYFNFQKMCSLLSKKKFEANKIFYNALTVLKGSFGNEIVLEITFIHCNIDHNMNFKIYVIPFTTDINIV